MNKPHAFSIVLVATVFSPSISVAGDIFDSPGPGYRLQIERLSPPADRTRSVPIRVEPGWLPSPLLRTSERDSVQLILRVERPGRLSPLFPGLEPDFSQPILPFISPQQIPTGLSLDAPTPVTPKKSQ
jgi:hypothetical protein